MEVLIVNDTVCASSRGLHCRSWRRQHPPASFKIRENQMPTTFPQHQLWDASMCAAAVDPAFPCSLYAPTTHNAGASCRLTKKVGRSTSHFLRTVSQKPPSAPSQSTKSSHHSSSAHSVLSHLLLAPKKMMRRRRYSKLTTKLPRTACCA